MDNNQFNNQQNNQYNQYNQYNQQYSPQGFQQNNQYNQYNQQYGQQPPQPPKKDSKGLIIGIIIAAVVIACLIPLVVYFVTKGSDSDYVSNKDSVTTEATTEKTTETSLEPTTEKTTEKTTEETTEKTTEETTEATTETTEDTTEATSEASVENEGYKIGSDEVGYLTSSVELIDASDEFASDFQSASYVKGYKNETEDYLIGIVRYDGAAKTPKEMADEMNSNFSAKEGTSTALSESTLGKDSITCQKLLAITEDGVYASFYFFEQDGDLYVIQIVYSIMYFVDAETISYTYEK